MSAAAESLMVITNCPDQAVAEQLADSLVRERLAACVNVLPGVISVYPWQGEIQHDAETTMLIKTTRVRYPAVEARLLEQHPYELPEIVAVPFERGLEAYFQWVKQCTGG